MLPPITNRLKKPKPLTIDSPEEPGESQHGIPRADLLGAGGGVAVRIGVGFRA